LDTVFLDDAFHYIAGIDYPSVYLGNRLNSSHIKIWNTETREMTSKEIKFLKVANQHNDLVVDSAHFYVSNTNESLIYGGDIADWIAHPLSEGISFIQFTPLNHDKFALISLYDKENTITRLGFDNRKPIVFPFKGLLKKQIDGIFCTEGTLHYDKKSKRLVFVYLYRNEFLVIDSHFQLHRKGNTVDSISQAKLKTAKIGNTYALISAEIIVNKYSYANEGYLYVNSNIPAKNEVLAKYSANAVIDIYALEDVQYQYSFYIPNFRKKKLTEFAVANGRLFSIQGNYLTAYSFSE